MESNKNVRILLLDKFMKSIDALSLKCYHRKVTRSLRGDIFNKKYGGVHAKNNGNSTTIPHITQSCRHRFYALKAHSELRG